MLPTLLNVLQTIGYPALWLIVFVAAAGLPLPINLVLLAAGDFAVMGRFNGVALALVALSASICGDSLGYFIGRRWGTKVLDWLEQPRRRSLISPRVIALSRQRFKQQGGWAVFLSRFLFSALGGTINLLAGADPYPYRQFLLFDVTGKVLGVVIPLALGYAFGAAWEKIGDLFGVFSGYALVFLALVVLTVYIIRTIRRSRAAQVATAIQEEEISPAAPVTSIRKHC